MDPVEARASLEDHIRTLQRRLEMTNATLAVAAVEGRRPRGLATGLAVAVVGMVGVAVLAGAALIVCLFTVAQLR
ncbi:MAG: hypothetical protein ABSE49_13085 [Polyangiaceae bacterium]